MSRHQANFKQNRDIELCRKCEPFCEKIRTGEEKKLKKYKTSRHGKEDEIFIFLRGHSLPQIFCTQVYSTLLVVMVTFIYKIIYIVLASRLVYECVFPSMAASDSVSKLWEVTDSRKKLKYTYALRIKSFSLLK